jgi:chaperonin GroES
MKCPFNKIIVRQVEAEEITSGGIIIPEKSREKNKPFRGEVVCAGEECKYVKVGDTVMFDSTKSFTDSIAGEKYVFMTEEAVLVIL